MCILLAHWRIEAPFLLKLFLQAVILKNSLIDRSINRSSNNNPDSTIEYDFIKFEL